MKTKEIRLDLGFIGDKAEKIKSLFKEFSEDPNDDGFYLKFETYQDLSNLGLLVHSNCFESKKHFKKILFNKMIQNI